MVLVTDTTSIRLQYFEFDPQWCCQISFVPFSYGKRKKRSAVSWFMNSVFAPTEKLVYVFYKSNRSHRFNIWLNEYSCSNCYMYLVPTMYIVHRENEKKFHKKPGRSNNLIWLNTKHKQPKKWKKKHSNIQKTNKIYRNRARICSSLLVAIVALPCLHVNIAQITKLKLYSITSNEFCFRNKNKYRIKYANGWQKKKPETVNKWTLSIPHIRIVFVSECWFANSF